MAKSFGVVARAWAALPPGIRNLYHQMPLPARKIANWLFFSDRPQLVTVQTGIIKGASLEVSPRTESGYFLGSWEPDVQQLLTMFVRPGMVVFDIGANIGYFVIALSRLVGPAGRVIAFEPHPVSIRRLSRHLELNAVANSQVEQAAAGEADGEAEFSIALTEQQGRFTDLPFVPPNGKSVRVRCRSIDSYVQDIGIAPDLILLDVEHAEGRVLRGMRRLLLEKKPLIVIEMHGDEAIAEAYAALESCAYRLYHPTLRAVQSQGEIERLGHYLAAPADFAPLAKWPQPSVTLNFFKLRHYRFSGWAHLSCIV